MQAADIDLPDGLPAGTPRFVSKEFIVGWTGNGVNMTRLWSLIKDGKVAAKQVGRRTLVDFISFQAWLAQQPPVDYGAMSRKPPGRRRTRKAA